MKEITEQKKFKRLYEKGFDLKTIAKKMNIGSEHAKNLFFEVRR